MNRPEIDVHIDYRSKPHEKTPYLRLPCVPRVGEILVLGGGARYRVVEVQYDDDREEKTLVVIEVEPI